MAEMGFAQDDATVTKVVFSQKTIDTANLLVPSMVLEHEALQENQMGIKRATGPEVAEVARYVRGLHCLCCGDLPVQQINTDSSASRVSVEVSTGPTRRH
eukprot:7517359-Pyramimonas_sp.AAC.1